MVWTVQFTGTAKKQARKLPENAYDSFKLLIKDLQIFGPVLSKWPNFGKIADKSQCYHCHIKKGRPTYVAVWKVNAKDIKCIEVCYVGTHENANYERIC